MHRDSGPGGWFPDPDGSGQLRWWSGNQWTADYRPWPQGRRRSPLLIVAIVALVVIIFGSASTALIIFAVHINHEQQQARQALENTYNVAKREAATSQNQFISQDCSLLCLQGKLRAAGQPVIIVETIAVVPQANIFGRKSGVYLIANQIFGDNLTLATDVVFNQVEVLVVTNGQPAPMQLQTVQPVQLSKRGTCNCGLGPS